jgi:hypothetical protein
MQPVHNDESLSPAQIRAIYEIDEDLTDADANDIGTFDDVLTAGSHCRAAKTAFRDGFQMQELLEFLSLGQHLCPYSTVSRHPGPTPQAWVKGSDL